MDKNLQDLAWAVLPKEFKEEVKKMYCTPGHRAEEYTLLQHLFGHHNLTSDAEREEMLMCEKSIVQQQYKRASQLKDDSDPKWKLVGDQIERVLIGLFGSKYLPDNVDSLSQNPPENCNKANLISTDDNKPAEPKFKVGDIVRFKYHYTLHRIDGFKMSDGVMLYYVDEVWAEESDLEPYTEPTDNENLSNPTPLTNKEVTRMKPIASMVSVYLATKEEDDEFRQFLHENGFKWKSKTSLISKSCWSPALEEGKIHYVYPDKTVTYCGNKASDTLTFSEFKKQYFLENVNHRQNIVNCDKQLDNILKDSFSKERRLNVATRIMSAILSNQMMLNNLAHGETTAEGVVRCVVDTTMVYTNALLSECEKGGKS